MTSLETERLAKLEERVENGFTEVRNDIGELKEMLKAQDRKYASKVTEKIVFSTLGAIGLAFIGALLALVLK